MPNKVHLVSATCQLQHLEGTCLCASESLSYGWTSVLWIELWLSCLERNYLKCFYLLNKPKLRKCFFSCIMFVLAHSEYFADLLCMGTDFPSGAPDDLYDIFVLCSSLILFSQHLYKGTFWERDWFKIISELQSWPSPVLFQHFNHWIRYQKCLWLLLLLGLYK